MKDKVSRRKFLGGTAAAVAGTAALSGEAAAHYVGLPAYTTVDLNIREGPGLGYNVIATAEQYTGVYIIDGPWDSDGYTWWEMRVNGDDDNNRITGYAVQQYTGHADVLYPSLGYISSTYYDERSYGYHSAVDIANDKYTNVYAGRGGYHTQHWGSGCGNYSVIDHGGGYETLYCHLNSWVAGHGVNVSAKQHIAEMGTTGNSTGDHVHYQIRLNGDPVYMPGEKYDNVWNYTGAPKNYDGLSSF